MHARGHCAVHGDGAAPFALRLARPLVGCVHSHLAAQTADRRGKVQVIDGGVFHYHRVAHRVHARGHGPHDFLPISHVDVLVYHDDELGVHELA